MFFSVQRGHCITAMPSHQYVDARSLALHRLVSAKVRQKPELLQQVRQTLARWHSLVDAASQPYLSHWEAAIGQGLETCLSLCEEDSPHAAAMRQCSPFGCVLSAKERFLFFKTWHPDHEPPST